jgi:nitrite reductase/ring-hydroxylating ferredoxin subunit
MFTRHMVRAAVTGDDLIVIAPWLVFAAGLSTIGYRLLTHRRTCRPPTPPDHHPRIEEGPLPARASRPAPGQPAGMQADDRGGMAMTTQPLLLWGRLPQREDAGAGDLSGTGPPVAGSLRGKLPPALEEHEQGSQGDDLQSEARGRLVGSVGHPAKFWPKKPVMKLSDRNTEAMMVSCFMTRSGGSRAWTSRCPWRPLAAARCAAHAGACSRNRAGRVRARDALRCPGHRAYFAADDSAALVGDNPDPGDPLVVQDVVELEHAADGKEQRIARVENTQRVSLVGTADQRPVPDVPLARLGGVADDKRVSHRALQVCSAGWQRPATAKSRPAPTVIG